MQLISGSVCCRFFLLLWRSVTGVFENSLICRLIAAAVCVCKKIWHWALAVARDSLIGRFVVAVVRAWKCWWHNSAVVRFLVVRDGVFPTAWPSSTACKLLTFVINLPVELLHWLYRRWKGAFDGSFFANIAFWIGEHVPLICGVIMVLLMNIPYERWNNAYSLVGYVMVFAAAMAGGMRRKSLRMNAVAVGPYLVCFLFAVCISWPLSYYPEDSFRFLYYHASCALCVLLVVSTVERAEQMESLAGFGCLGMAGTAAYGVLQGILGVEVNASFVDMTLNPDMPGRVFSYYENPNSFAEMLVMVIPVAVGLLFGARKLRWRLVGLVSALLGALALIMTYSRASWIGLVVAALIFLFFWKRRLIPLCIVVGLACLPLLPSSILTRILTIFNPNDSSTSSRLPLYEAAIRMIGESPITGVGLGTQAVKTAILEHNFYEAFSSYAHSHSLYLQTWLETGILGLIAFITGMFHGIKRAFKAVTRTKCVSLKLLILGGVSGICGSLVCGLVDYLWTYPRVMLIFWFVVGIAVAGIKIVDTMEEQA